MSILGSIFSKILGHHGTPPAEPASTSAPTQSAPPPAPSAAPTPSTGAVPEAPAAPSSPAAPATPVDVAAMLDGLAAKSGQTFDWRHSIVDMMKLLGLDSSLANRQALAHELSYSGDVHDSASMNIWLHKQVMTKLAQNGGTVPDDLKG